MVGLVLFQPEAFGGCRAGCGCLADQLEQAGCSSEGSGNFIGLPGGGDVSREFGGADDAVFLIEDDQAALRAGDTECGNLFFVHARLCEAFADCLVRGLDPTGGLLFAVAGRQAFDP